MSERLTTFLKTVSDFADEECSAIETTAQSFKDENVEEYREKAIQKNKEFIEYETSRIKSAANCHLSAFEGEKKGSLSELRQQLMDKVFDGVSVKIKTFTDSGEYFDFLVNSVNSAKALANGESVILLRPEDLKFSKLLQEKTGLSSETDNTIKLGGIKLYDKENAFTVDDTLDSRLNREKTEFTNCSSLKII